MTSRYIQDDALDLVFEFDLAAQILLAVRSGDSGSLRLTQDTVTAAYPPGGYAGFLTNHDQDRTFDVVGQDTAKAKQAATILLTGAGVPFIYYGEEVGLRGRKPDERIRTPMPWSGESPGFGFTTGEPWQPMADGVDVANVASQAADEASLLAHYRDLIRLRATEPALHGGAPVMTLEPSDPSVYATIRSDLGGQSVVVVSNLGSEPLDSVGLSLAVGPLCGISRATSVFTTTSVPAADPPPVSAPQIDQSGGFTDWRIGPLAPHQDMVIRLDP